MSNKCNCHICGTSSKDLKVIELKVEEKEINICNTCVRDAHSILNKEEYKSESKLIDYKKENLPNLQTQEDTQLIKIKEIKSHLDNYVIGQEEAKKILSTAVYSHHKRKYNDKIDKKSNILLIGPTGSGKTLLVETLAKKLHIPMVSVDATSLTESGYSGGDVDNIIKSLVTKAKDINEAEFGIVFIDEIDKIAKKEVAAGKKDIGGEGVQQGLLKMIEGAEVEVQDPSNMNALTQSKILFNTKNILFIIAGAFVGLEKKEDRKYITIGEEKKETVIKEEINELHMKEINELNKKLENFGLIPEFLGRFPIKTRLKKLEREDLLKIIKNSESSIINHYVKLFEEDNVKLKFSDCSFEKIVDYSIKNELGARGLQQVLEKIIIDVYYDIELYEGNELIINSKYIETLNPEELIISKIENKMEL